MTRYDVIPLDVYATNCAVFDNVTKTLVGTGLTCQDAWALIKRLYAGAMTA